MNCRFALISATLVSVVALSASAQERPIIAPLERAPEVAPREVVTAEEIVDPDDIFFVTCVSLEATIFSISGDAYPLERGLVRRGETILAGDGHSATIVDGNGRTLVVFGTWDVGSPIDGANVILGGGCETCHGSEEDPCRFCAFGDPQSAQALVVSVEGPVMLATPDGNSIPLEELAFVYVGDVITFYGDGEVLLIDRNSQTRLINDTIAITDEVVHRERRTDGEALLCSLWFRISTLGCGCVGTGGRAGVR